ncbi:MAG: GNAT family protein [Cyanobacteria bacterium P01_F01_bin.150]
MASSKNMIVLRLTTVEDLEFVIQAEQAEQNGATIGLWTRAEHKEAINNTDIVHFIIEHERRPVGYLILQDVMNPHGNLQIRRIVVKEKGQGYGRQSLKLVKKLAFETYQAHRLWLDVKPHNSRAKRLYESEGFVVEGTLRDCVRLNDTHQLFRDGAQQRISVILMSILRSEYSLD